MRNKHDINPGQLQTIGDRIRALREDDRHNNANKQSQEEFAAALGVSRDAVSNWERGNTPPLLTHILKMCDLYSVDVDYLLGRIDCQTHDLQFVHDVTGLSEAAINKLSDVKDRSRSADILSSIIAHRLFMPLIFEINKLTNPPTGEFTKAVVNHLVDDAPYVDSPDDLRAARQFYMTRTLTNIVDDMSK